MTGTKRPADLNRLAFSIVAEATGEAGAGKDPAAVALGRRGGLRGGPARAAKLTSARRSEIASKAAAARWGTGGGVPVTRMCLDTLWLLGGEASTGEVRRDLAGDEIVITPAQAGTALWALTRRKPPLAERTQRGTWRLTGPGWAAADEGLED